MVSHVMVAFTHAVEGRQAEYDRWYDDQHLNDVVHVPGIVGGRRYRALPTRPDQEAPVDANVAVYELEVDDPVALRAQLDQVRGTDAMPLSDAMAQPARSWIYRSIAPRRAKSTASPTHAMLVFGGPIEGHEAEYLAWYDPHLDDVLGVEGFFSANWFELASEVPTVAPAPGRYLAIYGIDTDDIDRTRKAMSEALPSMPSMAPDRQAPRQPSKAWFFETNGPRLTP